LLSSLYAIASNVKVENDSKPYFQIPENKKDKLHDLIIRNAIIKNEGRQFKMDIAIRVKEINSADFCSFESKGEVVDLGDLTYFFGYSEYDAKGLYVVDNELKPIETLKLGMSADFCLVDDRNNLIFRIVNGNLL